MQAKLALIVAQILSICPLSVRDSLSAALRVASHIDYRLVGLSVHRTVCHILAFNSKTKSLRKTEVGVNVLGQE